LAPETSVSEGEIGMTQYDAGFWAAVDRLVAKSEIIIDRPRGRRAPEISRFYLSCQLRVS
jgi:hypothetical protein